MRISVIVPTLNEELRIGRTLAALKTAQQFEEIIVADGASKDKTRFIVQSQAGVKFLVAPRGRARQLNAGASAATGDVFLFLHADATLPPLAAEHIREALRDERTLGGAFQIRTVNDGGVASWAAPLLFLADFRSRYSRLPYGDQAIFVRRETFLQIGGFPDQPLMEDLEFSQRLRRHGKIRVLPYRIEVSGRRFLARPFFYTLAVNVFPLLYWFGVSPQALKRLYGNPR